MRRISVVLPVYNERESIAPCLRGLWAALAAEDHEILVCYDSEEDSTLPAIAAMPDRPPSVRLVRNTLGRGALNAIRAGFAAAQGDVVVTSMADLSDPPEVILEMAKAIRSGADVVSGSRYMSGGSQRGGPWLKRTLSRLAGVSLRWVGGLRTYDATSNFRGYSRAFLDTVKIESRGGFEVALELTVKAHLAGKVVAEVPSSWVDRSTGKSSFRMWRWMPGYLEWYARAMAAPALVGAVWAAMAVLAAMYVGRYAPTMPFKDDLEMARDAVPGAPLSRGGVWALHNEHWVPLPKLIYIALTRLTLDFRAGMFLDVAILVGLSLALILVARRLRGRTSPTDAFFPLLFLHWGNPEILLMGFQAVTLPTALACAFQMIVAAGPVPPGRRSSLALAACLLPLPLCGGPGISQAPALTAWLGLSGLAAWRSRPWSTGAVPRGRLTMVATSLAAATLMGLYVFAFRATPHQTRARDVAEMLRIAAQVVSLAVGRLTEGTWTSAALGIGLLLIATVALLARTIARRPAERARAFGFLACMVGALTLALAIGWGRGGGRENAGLAPRYVTLTSPLLCAVYFAWLCYGPRRIGEAIRLGLCVFMAVLVWPNAELGRAWGEQRASAAAAVEADVRSGMPVVQIAARNWKALYVGERGCAQLLEILHKAGMPPFRGRPYEANPALLEFDMFRTLPDGSRSDRPLVVRRADGVRVLLAYPESEVFFALPAGATLLRGRFGIHPDSERVGHSDGVRFSVERLLDARPPTVLFERFLDPARRPEDCGFQALHVELPRDGQGRIVLKTSNPPGRNDEADWAFWTEIEIE